MLEGRPIAKTKDNVRGKVQGSRGVLFLFIRICIRIRIGVGVGIRVHIRYRRERHACSLWAWGRECSDK